MNFSEKFGMYRTRFEELLLLAAKQMEYRPEVLGESMRYSLLAGGKRVRPVLFFASLDCMGVEWRDEKELSVALECIHTYSLIHDDLPAMDNDDFRRGRSSNHKKFGEANAILAGDALLSFACEKMIEACSRGEKHTLAAGRLARAAGAEGMIAGQSADLLLTGGEGGEDDLFYMYRKKTGELIAAPVAMAAILSDGNRRAAEEFGSDLGVLFQLTDDILDVKGEREKMGKTLGKDSEEGKFTCIRVFGMERSEALADEYEERCLSALEEMQGDTSFLLEFVRSIRARRS